MNLTVVGAGGHVGLPLSIVLARSGHNVYGLDVDEALNARIMKGQLPFVEEDGQEWLKAALDAKRLTMTTDVKVIRDSEAVVVVIGTPVDENFNPRLEDLVRFFHSARPYLTSQLVILRSTVSPGTTDRLREVLELGPDGRNSAGMDLVYAPERVLQSRAIRESISLPQIIGAYSDAGYARAAAFFKTFNQAEPQRLTPIEAELGKLITNMARYVSFGLANEFHLICETFGANAVRIIDACNKGYPRLSLPVPGPNVGGPCLFKDGWFLIERIPYNELIVTAFRINEGMPMQIVHRLEALGPVRKVAVLGMTYKANSDDTRNSLSFKLVRQLHLKGYKTVRVEPNLPGYESIEDIRQADAVILMTPHERFANLQELVRLIDNPACWLVDLWGFWPTMRHGSRNGYFQAKEVMAQ